MTESEKEALGRRSDRVRQLLTPPGACMIDNGTLLNAMCDIAERERSWTLSTAYARCV